MADATWTITHNSAMNSTTKRASIRRSYRSLRSARWRRRRPRSRPRSLRTRTRAATHVARRRRLSSRGRCSGLSALLFFMGIAAAFSGAVLYAYYESRQEQTVSKVDNFVGGFSEQLDAAKKIVQAEGDTAKQDIRNQLDELQKFAASGSTLTGLLDKAQPSVWFVSTLDQAGAPSVGSAFVVFSDDQTSFLLTSYTDDPGGDAATGTGGHVAQARRGRPDGDGVHVGPRARSRAAERHPPEPSRVAVGDRRTRRRRSVTACSPSPVSARPARPSRRGSSPTCPPTACSTTPRWARSSKADRCSTPTARSWPSRRARTRRSASNPQSVFFAPLVRVSCDTVLKCPNGNPQPGG